MLFEVSFRAFLPCVRPSLYYARCLSKKFAPKTPFLIQSTHGKYTPSWRNVPVLKLSNTVIHRGINSVVVMFTKYKIVKARALFWYLLLHIWLTVEVFSCEIRFFRVSFWKLAIYIYLEIYLNIGVSETWDFSILVYRFFLIKFVLL